VLVHPPHSPDLAPSDFYLFGPIKSHMRLLHERQHFTTDAAVIEAVRNWFRTQPPKFYFARIENLVGKRNKCIKKEGNYVGM